MIVSWLGDAKPAHFLSNSLYMHPANYDFAVPLEPGFQFVNAALVFLNGLLDHLPQLRVFNFLVRDSGHVDGALMMPDHYELLAHLISSSNVFRRT